MIEGCNLAFEREERAGKVHLRGLEVFTCIIAVLTGLLAWGCLCPRRPTPSVTYKQSLGIPEVPESKELSDDQKLFVVQSSNVT